MSNQVDKDKLITRGEWRGETARVVHSVDSGGSKRGIQKPWFYACLRDSHSFEPLECALRSLSL